MATYTIIIIFVLTAYSLWLRHDKKKAERKGEDIRTLILNNEWKAVTYIAKRHLAFWGIALTCSSVYLIYRLYNGLYPYIAIFWIAFCLLFFIRVLKSYRNARFNANLVNSVETNEEYRNKLRNFLTGCKITVIDPTTQKPLEVWKDALKRDKNSGFYPVLLEADDYYSECLDEYSNENCAQDIRLWRHNALCCPPKDGKSLLVNHLKEQKTEYGEDWNEDIVGEEAEEYDVENELHLDDGELWLVEVPIEHSWQVFAYIPVADWNEWPTPEEHMAIAKYWQEKYDAKVVHISEHEVEYYLPKPITKDAKLLAKEQYSYCEDYVTDEYDNLKTLESALKKSSLWYFWWE